MKTNPQPARAGAARPTVAERLRGVLSFAYLAGLGPKRTKATPAPARAATKPAQAKRPVPPTDPDAELMGGPAWAIAARNRERARCEAIIESAAGRAHPKLARKLAFESRATEAEALELLAAQPPGLDAKARSREREARNPHVGVGLPEPGAAAVADRWDRVFARAGAG